MRKTKIVEHVLCIGCCALPEAIALPQNHLARADSQGQSRLYLTTAGTFVAIATKLAGAGEDQWLCIAFTGGQRPGQDAPRATSCLDEQGVNVGLGGLTPWS